MKKTISILLTITLLLAVFAVASAGASSLTDGVAGAFSEKDTPITQTDKTVILKKEITAFNPSADFVYGPEITYTYTLTPGGEVSVTDSAGKHNSNQAVTETTLPGITTGVKVGTGIAGTDESASGTLNWTNSDILDTSAAGTPNYKSLSIDFSDVVFTQPGVYRYIITESATTYGTNGVTESTATKVHIRYLDVYVMRSVNYDPTEITAADWTIYGFVCVVENEDITPDGDTTTTGAVKTNGFTAATNDSTVVPADQYHTYNLTIGKTLAGDSSMSSHKFPFDAAWTAGTATGNFQFIAETTGTVQATLTDGTVTKSVNNTTVAAHKTVGTAGAVSADGKDGNPSIANGGKVTYIGIPCGVMVKVTETNDVTGTTYTTTATQKLGSDEAAAVAFDDSSSATLSTDKKTATTAETKTVIYAQSAAPAADTDAAIQYTNTLSLISPTGYVARFAPYALMLIGGIVLLVVAMKHKKHTDEE